MNAGHADRVEFMDRLVVPLHGILTDPVERTGAVRAAVWTLVFVEVEERTKGS